MKLFFARAVLIATWCVCFPLRGPILGLQELWFNILLFLYDPDPNRPGYSIEASFRLQNANPRCNPWVRPMEVREGTWRWRLIGRASTWYSNLKDKSAYEQQVQELRKAVADVATKVNELKEQQK
jgi:hypothetical protein